MELKTTHWGSQAPENTRIMLLHGMGGTGSLWRPIAASLEDHYAVLAPDQRGHGGSLPSDPTAPDNYAPLKFGQDVVDTLESEGFYPTWVIGHSMGVRTACAAAHLRPDFVRGLILVDLGFTRGAGGGLGKTLGSFLGKLPPRFEDRAAARAFFKEHCPDPAIAQYLLAVSIPVPEGGLTFPFDRDALLATIEAAGGWPGTEWVREAAGQGKPVLILRGANSKVYSREDYERDRAELGPLPGVTFEEVQGAGHGLPFEKRPWFVDRVKAFTG